MMKQMESFVANAIFRILQLAYRESCLTDIVPLSFSRQTDEEELGLTLATQFPFQNSPFFCVQWV